MNLADEELYATNYDALITTVYELQADLTILSHRLASESKPDVSTAIIAALVALHYRLIVLMPSCARH